MLTSPAILSAAVAGGLVSSAGMSFGMLWGVSYFQAHHQMSLTAASLCASFYFWGCLPGMLGAAWLCSRYRNAALLLAVGAAGTTVTLALILFVLPGQWPLSAAMFVLGVFNSTYALAFTMVKDVSAEHLSGVAMGLTNMAIMGIGAMLFQPLIGILAHARGQEVPGATTLSVIIIAQLLALAVLRAGRSRATRSG